MSALAMATAPVISTPEFVAAAPEDVRLEEAPIEPGWIISGTPVARAGLHSESLDGKTATNIWDCTAGAFWWTFFNEETVVILEGSVKVTSQAGEVRILKVGDIAYFARDTKALWEIETYVRKIAFVRNRHSKQVQALRQMLKMMKIGQKPKMVSTPTLAAIGTMLPL
jgi:uncharacterized cupin superfamily protein